MGGLQERELNGLLEIIGEVHHADDVAGFREALLDVLARVMPAALASYNEVGFDGRPIVTIARPQPPEHLIEAWLRLGHQSPLVQRYLATRDGRAHRMSDVVTPEALHELDLYKEVFVPLGVEHQIVVTLPAPPEMIIGIVLADAEDYSDADRTVLDLARPHIIQAYANAALRESVRDVLAALAAGLEDTAEAVVVVDRSDRVQFATLAGRAALALAAGGGVDSGDVLPDALRADRVGRAHRLVLDVDDDLPLVVRRIAGGDAGTTALVFERGSRGASRELLEALGLTRREAEVLQGMMRGRSTDAIAAELTISPRTVHKHAERIFAKLGVHDRLAAVSAAWASLDSARAALPPAPAR